MSEIAECVWGKDRDESRRWCRHANVAHPQLSASVEIARCQGCRWFAAPGTIEVPARPAKPQVITHTRAMPIRRQAAEVKPCSHRSVEPIHHEPCTCKSANKIAIFKCELHKRCVPSAVKRSMIKDEDAYRACKCCEGCSDFVELLPIAA